MLEKSICQYLGFQLFNKCDNRSSNEHEAAINTTIYSIIKDYKDLSIKKNSNPQAEIKSADLQFQRDDDIVLSDISNIMPNKANAIHIKKDSSICLNSENHSEQGKSKKGSASTVPIFHNEGHLKENKHPNRPSTPPPKAPVRSRVQKPIESDEEIFIPASPVNFEAEFSRLFPLEKKLQGRRNEVQGISEMHKRKEMDGGDVGMLKTSYFGGVPREMSGRREEAKKYEMERLITLNTRNSSKEKISSTKHSTTQRSIGKHKAMDVMHEERYKAKMTTSISSASNTNTRVLKDISVLQVETPKEYSSNPIEEYKPRNLNNNDKLKRHKNNSFVVCKVDHRRNKSSMKHDSILEKQFKCAKIEPFDTVMSNLKTCMNKNTYLDHNKHGYIN